MLNFWILFTFVPNNLTPFVPKIMVSIKYRWKIGDKLQILKILTSDISWKNEASVKRSLTFSYCENRPKET